MCYGSLDRKVTSSAIILLIKNSHSRMLGKNVSPCVININTVLNMCPDTVATQNQIMFKHLQKTSNKHTSARRHSLSTTDIPVAGTFFCSLIKIRYYRQ